MRILSSDPQFEGLRERHNDLPAFEKAEWVPPWTFERLLSTALVRHRLRDLRLVRATPRWPTRHQRDCPQPHRGAFSLQSFVLHFCSSIPPGEFSLTLSWWTSTQVPHAQSADHLDVALDVPRRRSGFVSVQHEWYRCVFCKLSACPELTKLSL